MVRVFHNKNTPVMIRVFHNKNTPVVIRVFHNKNTPVVIRVFHNKNTSVIIRVFHNKNTPVCRIYSIADSCTLSSDIRLSVDIFQMEHLEITPSHPTPTHSYPYHIQLKEKLHSNFEVA